MAIAMAAVVGVLAAVTGARWSRSPDWTGTHTAAVLTAVLAGHTVIGLPSFVHTALDITALAVFGVVEVVLMLALLRTILHQPPGVDSAGATS